MRACTCAFSWVRMRACACARSRACACDAHVAQADVRYWRVHAASMDLARTGLAQHLFVYGRARCGRSDDRRGGPVSLHRPAQPWRLACGTWAAESRTSQPACACHTRGHSPHSAIIQRDTQCDRLSIPIIDWDTGLIGCSAGLVVVACGRLGLEWWPRMEHRPRDELVKLGGCSGLRLADSVFRRHLHLPVATREAPPGF